MTLYANIRRAMNGKLWYVHEQKMNEILAFLELKLSGGASSAEAISAIRAANELASTRAAVASSSGGKGVAVLPVYGLIMHRPAMDLSGPGGCSTQVLSRKLREVVDDPNVGAIVLDMDTPGGDVDGTDELATEIFNARKKKRIIAVSNCLCASAGYYLAAQASEIVVSPSSQTGSVGVYCLHEDDSEMLAKLGVKLTLIKFGENKAEGNSIEPLSPTAHKHMQEMVDGAGIMFEKAVARGRRITQDEVHKRFGQGRVFDAKTAVKIGLADRVGTLDDVLAGLGVGSGSGSSVRGLAASTAPQLSASQPGVKPAAVNADGSCSCECESCMEGDCSSCTHVGCDADGEGCVDCPMAADDGEDAKAKTAIAIEAERRERILQLL